MEYWYLYFNKMERIEYQTEREILIADQAHKDGFNSGQSHSRPSKDTIKLFKDMDDKIQKIEITLTEHGKDICFIKETTERLERTMLNFIDCADKKYAPMWAADAVKYVVISIVTLFMGAIGIIIFK